MIVIICFGIILDSVNSNQSIKFTDIVANILGDNVYPLQIVIKKYLMEYLFCTPYEIVFYEGFFSLIFFLPGLMISTNSEVEEGSDKCYIKYKENCYIDNLYSYLDQLNKNEIFIFFFVMTYYIFDYIFFVITIKKFSTYYVLVILLLEEDILYDYDKKPWNIAVNIIKFII